MKILRYFIVGASGEEPTYQCQRHKRCGFNPWVGKIPWRREWLATHSSILAWTAPWTMEPGRLQFMGLQRGRHNWSDLAHTHTWSVLLGDQSSQMKNSFFSIYNVLISHPIEYIGCVYGPPEGLKGNFHLLFLVSFPLKDTSPISVDNPRSGGSCWPKRQTLMGVGSHLVTSAQWKQKQCFLPLRTFAQHTHVINSKSSADQPLLPKRTGSGHVTLQIKPHLSIFYRSIICLSIYSSFYL